MTEQDLPGLIKHFADLPDPRDPRGIRHELVDIVCISILAVLCGANTYSQIYQYALAQEPWLRTFLGLRSGVPSQDTFERLFGDCKVVLGLWRTPRAGKSGFISYAAQAAVRNPEASQENVTISSLERSWKELGSPRSGGRMSPRRTA